MVMVVGYRTAMDRSRPHIGDGSRVGTGMGHNLQELTGILFVLIGWNGHESLYMGFVAVLFIHGTVLAVLSNGYQTYIIW